MITKEQYVPEVLNNTFSKTCNRILDVYNIMKNDPKLDSDIVIEQLHIILEKFAHNLIIGIVNSDTKFAAFHRIKKSISIIKPLFFIVRLI